MGGAGAGGAGVFLSENQAGTAVILLLGVIFLLMAVQGTAVRRITRDGGDFADRIVEERTVEAIQATYEDQGPQAAQAALDAATAARPQLERSPAVAVMNAQFYERSALESVRAAWRDTVNRRLPGATPLWTTMNEESPLGVDATFGVEGADEPRMAVEILYSSRGPVSRDRLANQLAKLDRLRIPYLIVSSSRATAQTELFWRYSPRSVPRQFVEWHPGDSVEILEAAIERLIGQAAGEIPLNAD